MNKQVIYLTKASVEHVETVFELLTPKTCRDLAISPVDTIEKARDFINGVNSNQNWRMFICHQEHGVIGGLSFTLIEGQSGATNGQMTAMFSYWLGENYRRKGYTVTAVKILLDSLKEKGVKHFLAQVYPYNIGSQKVLEKFNFRCDPMSLLQGTNPPKLVDFTCSM